MDLLVHNESAIGAQMEKCDQDENGNKIKHRQLRRRKLALKSNYG